jgi:hypothetical protein
MSFPADFAKGLDHREAARKRGHEVPVSLINTVRRRLNHKRR